MSTGDNTEDIVKPEQPITNKVFNEMLDNDLTDNIREGSVETEGLDINSNAADASSSVGAPKSDAAESLSQEAAEESGNTVESAEHAVRADAASNGGDGEAAELEEHTEAEGGASVTPTRDFAPDLDTLEVPIVNGDDAPAQKLAPEKHSTQAARAPQMGTRGSRGGGRGGQRGANNANGGPRPPRNEPAPRSSPVKVEAASDAVTEAASPDDVTSPQAGEGQQAPAPPRPVPYYNPNRVLTGGVDKKRLTPEELDKKMEDIRRRNQELKRKQEAVRQDEEQFRMVETAARTQQKEEADRRRVMEMEQRASDRAQAAERRKVQDALRKEREENAARKAKSFGTREWDVGKTETGRGGSNAGGDTGVPQRAYEAGRDSRHYTRSDSYGRRDEGSNYAQSEAGPRGGGGRRYLDRGAPLRGGYQSNGRQGPATSSPRRENAQASAGDGRSAKASWGDSPSQGEWGSS
ncbi:hypothetical protein HKX48_007896 [Thoreauomyces humboldtii]|nr:hypothetical protein HKX48_007896 [Thoreauomyces humboldtii]